MSAKMAVIKRQQGMTLLEALLVLAIGMSILYFSLKQYQTFRIDADIRQVRYNVDTLFIAAANYYYANCAVGDALSPTTSGPVRVTLTTLQTGGFLPSTFPTANPLIDATGANLDSGYILQFNKQTANRTVIACTDTSSPCTTGSTNVGTQVFWNVQVGILLKNTTKATTYKSLMIGDCLSGLNGSGATATVYTCSSSQTGSYVVFERPPAYTMSNINAQSNNWLTNPRLNQFNQMYMTNPMSGLTNVSHGTEYQYFYCGS